MICDPTAALFEQAAQALRETFHMPTDPEFPSDLSTRAGCLVDLTHRLEAVLNRLAQDVERLYRNEPALASDDGTRAVDHCAQATIQLRAAAARVGIAQEPANAAHSALAHLKLNG